MSTNAGSDDARWTRMTPPPDEPDCYSFFGGLAQVDDYREIYAFGWQGIAHWQEGSPWAVQLKTDEYFIASVLLFERSPRDVWAVGNGGGTSPAQWGTPADYGAIFHYAWPGTNWERVALPGISLHPQQILSQIIYNRNHNQLFVVGTEGLILRGVLQGTNWAWKQLPSGTEHALKSVAWDPDFTLWVVGGDGLILRSTDEGETWVECACYDEEGSRVRANLGRVRFFGRQGWIVGDTALLKCELP